MNKYEFLDGLREQLNGQMSEGNIQSHMRYYQEYIETQVRNGRSEAEVIEELGAPQLIAKTLLDTEAIDSQNDYDRYDTEDYDGYETNDYDVTYSDDFSSTYRAEDDSYGQEGYVKKHTWHIDLSTWYGKLLVIAVTILIIAALLFVIGTVVPILIVVFLILSVISYFKKRR